jgi:lysophospholipase L1-like esterase
MSFFGAVASATKIKLGLPTPSTTIEPSTADVVLVFDGNSLTNGMSHAGSTQYYPNQVNNNYAATFNSKSFYSYGVNGQTLRDMMADAATQIYSKAVAGKENILIGWEDVNGIYGGTVTAQENYDDMVTYFQDAKNAGMQHCILITGFYPRKSTDGKYWYNGTNQTTTVNTYEPVHTTYLDLVKNADINTVPWDYHIDLRDASNIGGTTGQVKDETYFGDYFHLTAAGYDIVAQKVIAEINKIFGI